MSIDVISLAEQDTRLHKAAVHEYAGPCPDTSCRCQTDGFRVKWSGERWSFMCRGCWDSEQYLTEKDRKRGWGDEIDYLRHYRKMSFQEAKTYLAEQGNQDRATASPARRPSASGYQAPTWQKVIADTVKECEQRLWAPDDTSALDYAHSRGLLDETIRKAHLGYSLKDGIPRLVIPNYSLEVQHHVAVYRRDLRPDVPKDQRWKDAPGGTKSVLYLADCLQAKRPTVLVEAPLDALSLAQECGDLVNVVATAGSGCCHNIKSLAALACMPCVLVAFDADAAGDEDAQWWLKRLKNARRFRPFLHDINDMLVDGWDIRQWLIDELAKDDPLVAASDMCQQCGHLVEWYSNDGTSYCDEHWQALQTSREAAHHRFIQIAQHLADAYPGGCTLHIDPPGYTLSDRVRDIKAEARTKEQARHAQEMLRRRALRSSGSVPTPRSERGSHDVPLVTR
jgi:hypothetical protein